jgi:hypothetical protein
MTRFGVVNVRKPPAMLATHGQHGEFRGRAHIISAELDRLDRAFG